ncbi:MAG TPA: FAD-dependent monooxygenase [Nonomuraea sp.]|nr:FAD-dependent monooxygenase [Nonomuraea sp.]
MVSHGPTLNLALQDAANLAWKLAARLRGWAPEGLLDSYETERHASGERVLTHTRAATALMAPGGDVTALRRLFAELLDRTENTHMVAALVAGADVRYDMGEEHPAAPTGWFVPPINLTTDDGHEGFIRPDGYVAWAGADPDSLKTALTRWFSPG